MPWTRSASVELAHGQRSSQPPAARLQLSHSPAIQRAGRGPQLAARTRTKSASPGPTAVARRTQRRGSRSRPVPLRPTSGSEGHPKNRITKRRGRSRTRATDPRERRQSGSSSQERPVSSSARRAARTQGKGAALRCKFLLIEVIPPRIVWIERRRSHPTIFSLRCSRTCVVS